MGLVTIRNNTSNEIVLPVPSKKVSGKKSEGSEAYEVPHITYTRRERSGAQQEHTDNKVVLLGKLGDDLVGHPVTMEQSTWALFEKSKAVKGMIEAHHIEVR